MEGNYTYKVESYSVFFGVDESILLLNEIINPLGYQFIIFNLQELEEKFADLFSIPREFKSKRQINHENMVLSNELFNAIQNNPYFGMNLIMTKRLYFLKYLNDFEQKVIDNTVEYNLASQIGAKLQKFTANLIQQLRLFKNGDVNNSIQFQITSDSRHILTRFTGRYGGWQSRNLMTVTKNEVQEFREIFSKEIINNDLIELALNNFNLSYEIIEAKTKYITLMTCLESIFNHAGGDQITHTVSRHLSLILSSTKEEFEQNYSRIKHLYKIRSSIVHGATVKENLTDLTNELQQMVRKAINYCRNLSMNKKQLFDYLNAKGFNI
jgi:hypothetical protein